MPHRSNDPNIAGPRSNPLEDDERELAGDDEDLDDDGDFDDENDEVDEEVEEE